MGVDLLVRLDCRLTWTASATTSSCWRRAIILGSTSAIEVFMATMQSIYMSKFQVPLLPWSFRDWTYLEDIERGVELLLELELRVLVFGEVVSDRAGGAM